MSEYCHVSAQIAQHCNTDDYEPACEQCGATEERDYYGGGFKCVSSECVDYDEEEE